MQFRRALALKPSLAEVHYNLGNALMKQWKLDEAVTCYERALALRPDFVEAYCNLGNALKEQGKLGAAIDRYRQALAVNPNYADAYNNLGSALLIWAASKKRTVPTKRQSSSRLINPSFI